MLTTYGTVVLDHPLTPTEYFQLWLNLGRMRIQKAHIMLWALLAARSRSDLPREWFDAIALDVSEVDELEFNTNAARMSQRAAERGPFGG